MVPALFMALRTVSRAPVMVTGASVRSGNRSATLWAGERPVLRGVVGVPSAEEVTDAAGQRDQHQPAALERSLTPHSDAPALTRTPQRLCPFK